jgi:hypothetical protein
LSVTTNADITGSLVVDSSAQVNSLLVDTNADITGSLVVDSSAQVGSLVVDNLAKVKSLEVETDASITGSLTVDIGAQVGLLTVDTDADILGSINVSDEVVIGGQPIPIIVVDPVSGTPFLVPKQTNLFNIGSPAVFWNTLYARKITLDNSIVIDKILDEDDLGSNSPTALATQRSIKFYVDNSIGGAVNDLKGEDIELGNPNDLNLNDGAYLGFTSQDTVTNAIDDLNEIVNNVRLNTFIRQVDFTAVPQAGGAGTNITLTMIADGNPNQYIIDWGNGNTTTTSSTTASQIYSSNVGSPFTVKVTARNTLGSGTGSQVERTKVILS